MITYLDPCAPPVAPPPVPSWIGVKETAVLAFVNQAIAATSDAIDCRQYNALHIQVFGSGSVTITAQGSDESGGNYLTLPDGNAIQTGLSANKSYDVVVGQRWCKLVLSSLTSGTWTVWATPFISAGLLSLQVQESGIAAVQASTQEDNATTSWADITGMSVSITPSAVSSLLIWANAEGTALGTDPAAVDFQVTVDGVAQGSIHSSANRVTHNWALRVTGQTAAAHTIKVQHRRGATGDGSRFYNGAILVMAIPE